MDRAQMMLPLQSRQQRVPLGQPQAPPASTTGAFGAGTLEGGDGIQSIPAAASMTTPAEIHRNIGHLLFN